MTEAQPTELPPCTRGCTYPVDGDNPAKPKPATHGQLCASDFYRITAALESVPDLIANMRAQLARQSAAGYGERVSGSSNDGTPVPLRVDVLDASDSLYAKLVLWTEIFAGELHTAQPHAAVWINFKEVQGMRPVNTPDDARALAAELAGWFTVRLDELCASAQAVAFHDDVCYGWEDALGVFPLLSRYGVEPRRPRADAAPECPVCGARDIFVKWPDKFDPELAVMCARCKHVVDPDEVNPHARRIDGATESTSWVDELPAVAIRCSGGKDCAAQIHAAGCYAVTREWLNWAYQQARPDGEPVFSSRELLALIKGYERTKKIIPKEGASR